MIDTGASKRFSQSLLINTLDSLLSSGQISFREYLERIPDGIVTRKSELLERAKKTEFVLDEEFSASEQAKQGKEG